MSIILREPANGAESVHILNDTERELVLNGYGEEGSERYETLKGEFFAPAEINFRWEGGEGECVLHISTDPNFCGEKTYVSDSGSFSINWLLGAKKYFWKVSDSAGESETFCFTTEDTPRSIYIEGIRNTRDFGGWKTIYGKRMKEGLLYRGEQLERITEKGLRHCLDDLGIRCELDLRWEQEAGSGTCMLGDGIRYYNIPSWPYVHFMMPEHAEISKTALKVFCDPDNFPIIEHCVSGRDRGATIAFVVELLCGVPCELAEREYDRTILTDGFRYLAPGIPAIHRDYLKPFIEQIKAYGDGNINENIEKMVVDIIGLTKEEIEKIRENLTEEI